MKLLFDENLSFRLVRALADIYPGSAHMREVGLIGAEDPAIWAYAARNGFLLTSKDTDFYDRSALLGAHPKVVWLRIGTVGSGKRRTFSGTTTSSSGGFTTTTRPRSCRCIDPDRECSAREGPAHDSPCADERVERALGTEGVGGGGGGPGGEARGRAGAARRTAASFDR